MEIAYFKKSEARVTRVVAEDWVELEVPGYPQRFCVGLSDTASVGPAPLTTLSAREGSSGDLYLSPAFLSANGIACDLDPVKWPDALGGSFAGFWRFLASPARTPAIAGAIDRVRAYLQSLRASARSQEEQETLVRSVRAERELNDKLAAAFPHPTEGREKHLDRVASSIVAGLLCGAIRTETLNPLAPAGA